MCVPVFSTLLCASQKLPTFCFSYTQHTRMTVRRKTALWNSFNYICLSKALHYTECMVTFCCPPSLPACELQCLFTQELLYFVIIRIPAARVYCINWVWFPVRRGPGVGGGRRGRLTTCSRAEPVSALAGCGYPCSERGGHVAKTSGHTLSVVLHLTPSLLPDHPVVCPLFLCSYQKSWGHVLAVCGAVAYILHYLCPFLVSFSLKYNFQH